MNKSELVSAMAVESGLTKMDCQKALDGFLAVVEKTLKAGDKVSLVGFGTFAVVERSARTGINPATKQKIEIPAKKSVKFKAGSDLAID
ncbi:Histone-like bacterial DNA-binding protein [gut metagenome]|uniref:Histone-like bacterial DNA-binding protein n=1 Tax=gut metagenome TaxID=749906 RepID=J9GR58_9ZZZZ